MLNVYKKKHMSLKVSKMGVIRASPMRVLSIGVLNICVMYILYMYN